ncbi:MAG: TolC family protein [Bacteroidota bacterium]
MSFLWIFYYFSFIPNGQTQSAFIPENTNEEYIYTLSECWSIAERLTPEIEAAELAVSDAILAEEASKVNSLPRAEGQTQLGYQFGRSIDPTTNSFADQGILFNSTGISADWQLYAGGRLKAARRQAGHQRKAAQYDQTATTQDLHLRVLTAYRQVLESSATLTLQSQNITNLRSRLSELNYLIETGVRRANDRFELELSLARAEQDSAFAQQQLLLSQLALANVTGLDPETPITATPPSTKDWPSILQDNIGYNISTNNLPAIQANRARQKAAQEEYQMTLATMRPSIAIFGQLNTNYSAAAQELAGLESVLVSQSVILDGQLAELAAQQTVANYTNKPLLDQLNDNFNQTIGVQVRIPIFDAGRNRVQRQRIQLQQRQLQVERRAIERNWQQDIAQFSQSLAEARTAYQLASQNYLLAKSTLQKANEAYRSGGLSTSELNRIQEEVQLASLRVLRAKYTCYFSWQALLILSGK